MITEFHIHHSVFPADRYNGSNSVELTNEIREMHRAKGWRDAGYHYIIFPDGEWEHARPIDLAPASATGHNGTDELHPCAVCLYGDLRTDPITDGYVEGVRQLLGLFNFIYGRDFELKPHRSMQSTFCPMRDEDWDDFIRRVRAT